jgi:hypothetical protein
MRRAARVDGNHAVIVAALRKVGCRVLSLAAVGKGCPDLICRFRDKLFLVEIKNRDGKGRVLTEQQKEFHQSWPVIVADSVDEAINEIVRRGR